MPPPSVTEMTGALSFSREKFQSLTLTYADTGMSPTEVNLSAMGVELEVP